MIRLETPTKFYEIIVEKDLLDDLIVVCFYGGKSTRRRQCKRIKVDTSKQLDSLTEKITKTRLKHGYWIIYD